MQEARITVNPNIHFGKPCVKGTRIPVYAVLELLEADLSYDTIIKDYYPTLTHDDIRACVQYATQIVKNEEIHIASA